jgi:hypothetical protein
MAVREMCVKMEIRTGELMPDYAGSSIALGFLGLGN